MTEKAAQGDIAAAFGPWGAWAEAMSELGAETMRFVTERLREDAALQQRLLQARSVEEVRHVQASFLQTAIDQYTAETGRVVEIGEEMSHKLGIPRTV